MEQADLQIIIQGILTNLVPPRTWNLGTFHTWTILIGKSYNMQPQHEIGESHLYCID